MAEWLESSVEYCAIPLLKLTNSLKSHNSKDTGNSCPNEVKETQTADTLLVENASFDWDYFKHALFSGIIIKQEI